MDSEFREIWRKIKPIFWGTLAIFGCAVGVLSLAIAISERAKTATSSFLKTVAPWIWPSLHYLDIAAQLALLATIARLSYRTFVKGKRQIKKLEEALEQAKHTNQAFAQREIETEQIHRQEIEHQALTYSAQVESLKEELKCLCHGNLVADEVILLQESLEDFLSQTPNEQARSTHRTLGLIARSIRQVTKEADSLLHCAFYVPSGPIGKLKDVGWFHDDLKGKGKTELGKRAKAFIDKHRDSRDRGFLPYPLGDDRNPDYFIGVQALWSDENLFAMFAVVARSENALQSCEKILELFARMAGKLSPARATSQSKATSSLIPSGKEASRETQGPRVKNRSLPSAP